MWKATGDYSAHWINVSETKEMPSSEKTIKTALHAFDLSPSLSGGEYIDPIKDGRLIVNFKFARDTPQTLTLVVYMQFYDSFSINEGGKITTYFSH